MFPMIYGVLAAKGGFAIDYLFLDNFTIDQPAPLVAPFTADGVGEWGGVTNGAEQQISGDQLVANTTVSSSLNTDRAIYPFTQGNGTISVWRGNPSTKYYSMVRSGTTGFINGHVIFQSKTLNYMYVVADTSYYYALGTSRELAIVGNKLMVVGGFDVMLSVPTDLQVRHIGAGSTVTRQVAMANPHGNWDAIENMRTNVITTPSNETFTADKDSHYYFRVDTLPTAGSASVAFREQDVNNRWEININSAGGMILDEVVAGTPTTRVSVAGVIAGDVIMCRANDETIGLMRHVGGQSMVEYAGAVNFKTETAGRIAALGTGGAISDFETWDTFITGEDLGRLEAIGVDNLP